LTVINIRSVRSSLLLRERLPGRDGDDIYLRGLSGFNVWGLIDVRVDKGVRGGGEVVAGVSLRPSSSGAF